MKGGVKHALRTAVVNVLYALGVLQFLTRILLRRRAVVLMYHRVLPDAAQSGTWSHPAIIVSRETFERHMRVLRRYFRVLSPAEFQQCLDRGRFEPRSCLVTFDDGWIDTYTEAWPVLRRYRVPALVFLPSAFIGTGEVFWQERLGRVLHAIWNRARAETRFAEQAKRALAAFELDSLLDCDDAQVRGEILSRVRSRKADDTIDPAEPVRALLPLVPEGDRDAAHVDRFISWEQAREMARDGVAFGAHGETHRRLTTLPPQELRREVEASREALRQGLITQPGAFCYPNGDWNANVAEVVAATQFRIAFSTERGFVEPGMNRYALRRVNVHEDMTRSTAMFLARLIGVV